MLNLSTGFGAQLLTAILRFVTRTVFIHTLGGAYLGINGYFSDILTMLSLTELGLDTAINYKLYKPLAERDLSRIRQLMNFYRLAYRCVGVAIVGLGVLLIPFLPKLIKDYDSLAALGINAVIIFLLYLAQSASSYLFFAWKSAIVKADQKLHLLNVASYVVMLASNGVQILVLYAFKNFYLYTAVLIAFTILQNYINARIAKRHYPDVFGPNSERLGREEIRSIFKDLGALFVYRANGVVLKATDNMVLGAFIGLSVVGLYSNYLMFYNVIKNTLSKFYASIKASMGNLFSDSTVEKQYEFFEIVNYLCIMLYGTAAVGIAVCANEFISTWIGDQFLIPQPFPILIGIELVFAGLKTNLGQIRNITGAFRQMWFRPVMGVIVNLVVSVALVQFYGIYGVIVGTITADLTTNFMVDPMIIHKYSFNGYKKVSYYYWKNIRFLALLSAVCALDFVICRHFLSGLGWFSVIVHVILCGLSVPAVFSLFYRHTKEYLYLKQTLLRLMKPLAKRLRGK